MFMLLWTTISWHEYHDRKADLLSSSLRLVRQDMASLQREMEREIGSGELSEAGHALSSRNVNISYQTLIATDHTGQVLYATQHHLIDQLATEIIPDFNLTKFALLQKNNRPEIIVNEDNSLITAYFPLTLARKANEIRPSRIGALYLVYDMRPDQILISLHIWHSIWQIGAGLLILLLIMIVVLNYFITRPINQIIRTAKALSDGDTDAQCAIPGSTELAALAQAFNSMSSQLKQRFEQLQQTETTLLEANQQQRQILNSTSAVVYLKDLEGKYLFINDVYKKIFHVCNLDIVGKTDHQLFSKDMADAFRENDMLAAQSETPMELEETAPLDDGNHFYLSIKFPIKNAAGKVYAVCGVSTDITDRKKAEDQIRKLSTAVEQSPASVMITDTEERIEYVNSTFERVSGYSADEVIGQKPRFLQSGNTSPKTYAELWQALNDGQAWKGVLENRKKNGDSFWEQLNIAPVLDESGNARHYLSVAEDITQKKQQQERILHQAHFDALTDLPNRFLALDRLKQVINDTRHDEPVAVLFLDLDDFKKVNDSLGHETGDKLLIEAAERLTQTVRSADTVARLGGDEFIILLQGLKNAADTRPVVEHLLKQFRAPFRVDGRELMLTVSIGIAIYPDNGKSSSELLRNADSAMYHAKELGRNTFSYFTESMNQAVSRRLELEEQIHGALERGEFNVLYQPQIDIRNNAVIGAEALLRWHNPALGQVSPEEFIPIAEQNGLIIPIGYFVLTQALEVLANWQQHTSRNLRMAVNLSPRQFRDTELLNNIKSAINQAGVSPESLELEITEGVLISGQSHIDDTLIELNELGVLLALDDFGTGYSSLSYLRRYPFNVLKIDRSFVRDISIDTADKELISAAIAMSHALGLKVVAEGAETQEQLSLLEQLNCDIAQGYLFSKPVPSQVLFEFTTHEKQVCFKLGSDSSK